MLFHVFFVMRQSVFTKKSSAIELVKENFELYVTSWIVP